MESLDHVATEGTESTQSSSRPTDTTGEATEQSARQLSLDGSHGEKGQGPTPVGALVSGPLFAALAKPTGPLRTTIVDQEPSETTEPAEEAESSELPTSDDAQSADVTEPPAPRSRKIGAGKILGATKPADNAPPPITRPSSEPVSLASLGVLTRPTEPAEEPVTEAAAAVAQLKQAAGGGRR